MHFAKAIESLNQNDPERYHMKHWKPSKKETKCNAWDKVRYPNQSFYVTLVRKSKIQLTLRQLQTELS